MNRLIAALLAIMSPLMSGCGGGGGSSDSSARLFEGPLMYLSTQVELYGLGSEPTIRDLNGDGLNDIFYMGWPDGINGQFYVRRGDKQNLLDETESVASCDATVDGDLNNDGRIDIACISVPMVRGSGGNQLQILFSRPDGQFTPSQTFDVKTLVYVQSFAMGDADGDGLNDIFMVGDSQVLTLLNRSGSFEEVTSPVDFSFLLQLTHAVDANRDGFDDLMVLRSWPSVPPSVNLLLSNGDGSFATPRSLIPSGEYPMWPPTDSNRDGYVDVLVTDYGREINVYLGDANTSYSDIRTTILPTTFEDFYEPQLIGDFDEDGFPDLLLVRGTYDDFDSEFELRVARGLGDGTFDTVPGPVFHADHGPSLAGDLNNDGHLDLMAHAEAYSFFDIYFGNGDGTFGLNGQTVVPVASGSSLVHVIADPWHAPDLDNDGNADLVSANYPVTALSVHFGSGDGNFQTQDFTVPLNSTFYFDGIADVDDDDDLDILGYIVTTGRGFIIRNDGERNLTVLPSFETASQGSPSFIGDIDQDGHTDLLYADLSILWGLGNAAFEAPATKSAKFGPGGSVISAGDVNGDGRTDLIGVLDPEGIRVWPGTANRSFGAPVTTALNGIAPQAVFEHFDADSKLDAVALIRDAKTTQARVAILHGTSDSAFEQTQEFALPGIVDGGACKVADLDDDADQDVVCTYWDTSVFDSNYFGPVFGFGLLNDGQGHFERTDDRQVYIEQEYTASNFGLVDVNADGLPDLVHIGRYIDLNIALGIGDGTFGPTFNFTARPMDTPALFGDYDNDGDADVATIDYVNVSRIVVQDNQLVRR